MSVNIDPTEAKEIARLAIEYRRNNREALRLTRLVENYQPRIKDYNQKAGAALAALIHKLNDVDCGYSGKENWAIRVAWLLAELAEQL